MSQYEVIGADENIDVRGESHKPGDRVELSPEDAVELVEKGVLKPVEEADGQSAGQSPEPTPETPEPTPEA